MAGRGPAPATTKRTTSTQVGLLAHAPFEIPVLPKSYKATVWVKGEPQERRLSFLPATREWWEAWKRSPMASDFAEVHWLRLLAIAKLKDRYERDPSPANATELRLQEQRFGGTPEDLLRLGHRIVRPTSSPSEPAAGPGAPVTSIASARRARLGSNGDG